MSKQVDNILEIFNAINLEELEGVFDFKAIAALLSLPEAEFELMEEVLLNEMEKAMNSTQERLAMSEVLKSSGMSAIQLTEQFESLSKAIEEGYKDKFSQGKIDFLKRTIAIITKAASELEGIAGKIIPVAIEFCHPNALPPEYARPGDAGMDVYAVEDIEIKPGETVIVPTGLKMAIPLGYEIQVRPRSGLSVKTPLRVANSPGTIDANFRGEIGVIVTNTAPRIADLGSTFDENGKLEVNSIVYGGSYTITKGMRFAQLVLKEVPLAAFYEVSKVSDIGFDRGGGFGSSGGEGND